MLKMFMLYKAALLVEIEHVIPLTEEALFN